MKLEVGKKYVCRNKPEIEYVWIEHMASGRYPAAGVMHHINGDVSDHFLWTLDGRWDMTLGRSNKDLVAEYVEPISSGTVTTTASKPRLQIADVVAKLHRMLNRREYLSRELQNDLVCDLLDLARKVINKPTKD